MEERKTDYKNIVIIVLSAILVFLVIVLIINLKKPDVVELSGEYNTFDLTDCINSSCSKEFKFNDNVINVEKKSDTSYIIKCNDYIIFASEDKPYIGNNIYTFKDVILFTTQDEEKNLSIYKYGLGNDTSMKIELPNDNWFIKKVGVDNNKIMISTSRFKNDKSFFDDKNDTYVNIDSCFNYDEFKDRDAEQTFEFSYADDKFTDIKSSGIKKLSELSEYSKLCN